MRRFTTRPVISLLVALLVTACNGKNSEDATHSDELDSYIDTVWLKSNWWNGSPFLNGWCDSQVTHDSGVMTLALEQLACQGQTSASGEYATLDVYGYGYYAARLKATNMSGTVTGFFTYTAAPHDEIDFEILGKDPTKVQVNYWTNGVEHPVTLDLGFDASAEYHTYAFAWSSNSITWYVDGVAVHTEDGSNGALPTTAGKLFVNLWACDSAISGWCGSYTPSVTPVTAYFDWFDIKPY